MTRIFRAGGYVEYGRVNGWTRSLHWISADSDDLVWSLGNLALARALGDFEYKKNTNITAEEQIITANPEITEHVITEDDEFLIIACDGQSPRTTLSQRVTSNPLAGIWDCLTSQQCVDVVRLLISQGKDLPEIAEIVCELCLAPDTDSAGIGCDNMTMLIVALLNHRTKDQWRAWVTDRVKNRVGHATPEALPQIYSATRLTAFNSKRTAAEAREKERPRENNSHLRLTPGSLRGRDIDSDDSDDDLFPSSFIGRNGPVMNSFTKLELNGEAGRSGVLELDADEDMTSEPFAAPPHETPTPPKSHPNGTTITMEQKPPQFESLPGPDEAPPVVRAEGLMDTSEDPLKG